MKVVKAAEYSYIVQPHKETRWDKSDDGVSMINESTDNEVSQGSVDESSLALGVPGWSGWSVRVLVSFRSGSGPWAL
jgi:hypothetical protein